MAKLNIESSETLRGLLEKFEELCNMMEKIGTASFVTGMTVQDEENSSDFLTVNIDDSMAKDMVMAQLKAVQADLKDFGIEVEIPE